MKKVIFLMFFFVSLLTKAQEIKWMSFEEAIAAQKKAPKKILIDAYTNWCGFCKMYDKNTFSKKEVANYINKNFYAVKFNAEGNDVIHFKGKTFSNPYFDPNRTRARNSAHQLASYFRIRSFPSLVFLDEDANYLDLIPGYKTPTQLEIYLKLFASDKYKDINSSEDWEEYISTFKYEFGT